ncbi:MAG: site-specific DNA-methyltransferase [Ignavibacteriales bacterium]|nr:site-specific DNA-methyltransferase [Ignavibacteriales bacterium]MCF8305842.1 site-specific DNA-methyltransferase [Ignavibacteriales bacterium]MCF8315564.1 site-specific DNA-methyltransferase [Ignavibacteriales bacterium]MCF8436906.1 site-specific DNA-methyltransferase [Ignavibacteriales bacterium]
MSLDCISGKTILGDIKNVANKLPPDSVNMLFLDPPYNLYKDFNGDSFSRKNIDEYSAYIESWFPKLIPLLKKDAAVFFCADWYSSVSVFLTISKYLKLQNRITWQREKGRGSKRNWKNSHEDIWFFTNGNSYKFYPDRIKEKRKVIAPYRIDGKPKDWEETEEGNFRLTYPSNLWTDLSVPYWSMSENTDHPTQKPEKLLAKLILATTDINDLVFDPFLGSGTSSVVAKKLGRRYAGVEKDRYFACLAEKRLQMAESDKSIQGYFDGVFWERNSLKFQKMSKTVLSEKDIINSRIL